jgi:hypothetical protein
MGAFVVLTIRQQFHQIDANVQGLVILEKLTCRINKNELWIRKGSKMICSIVHQSFKRKSIENEVLDQSFLLTILCLLKLLSDVTHAASQNFSSSVLVNHMGIPNKLFLLGGYMSSKTSDILVLWLYYTGSSTTVHQCGPSFQCTKWNLSDAEGQNSFARGRDRYWRLPQGW